MSPQRIVTLCGITFFMLVALGLWGCPQYNVWEQGLAGQAKLAEAEYSRQIAIEEAQAVELSAESFARAEVTRAHGVAEANDIIADGLGGAEGYLRYLWIQTLENGGNDIIYVPTEAGIPILEAGRVPQLTQ
jgi:regulator of protease activity HflC (stomatin/prohibitin superfamily)